MLKIKGTENCYNENYRSRNFEFKSDDKIVGVNVDFMRNEMSLKIANKEIKTTSDSDKVSNSIIVIVLYLSDKFAINNSCLLRIRVENSDLIVLGRLF